MDAVNQTPDDFCPFVGLQPYGEDDQDYFFGRERDSRIISSNLYAAPLTVLYGPSGVGKSSILRAGVHSRLLSSPRTAVFIFDGWADQNLLNALKFKCLEVIATAAESSGDQVDFNLGLPLDDFLFSLTQAFKGTLLVIFDQFEEYFLYHPEIDKDNAFDAEFARAVNRDDIDLSFLVSMREDSLSRLDRFRARIPNMLSNSLRLRHLDADSARDAMRKPLEVYATQHPTQPPMSIEEALVEELVEEIQVEKLTIGEGGKGMIERNVTEADIRIEAPFLQLALTRLWNEEREQGSQIMRLETLHKLGGAGRIIRTHMDSAMNALSPDEQETAADLFRYMVTPSGTKIAYTVADLEYYAKSTQSLQPVMDKLSQGNVRIVRPVTSPGEPDVIRYQIYHDVLAPAVLDWRARYENSKQMLSLFSLFIEKGDMDNAFELYQDIIERTPHLAFFPERYKVQKILGKGELGVNYLVYDLGENRLLAATILDSIYVFTTQDLEQFVDQINKLSSPRISRILGFGHHRDHTFILSEFVEGPTLNRRLGQGVAMSYREAMHITRQVTEALEDGHLKGLPHLNLRPSNIMLSSDGVKLVNYGLSMLTSLNRNKDMPAKTSIGDYLAPEQLSGKGGDERSDIYALGTILYEMLTGHPPSVGRFYYPSEINVEVTEAVDVLIDHARESDAAKRYASAEAMRDEIDRITSSTLRGGLNTFLRIGLAWVSKQFRKLSSGKGLIGLLLGMAILLLVGAPLSMPISIRLPARLILPLLLNSFVISILFDWLIRAFARRRGLGSLITTARGMGVILGLAFTINLIRLLGFDKPVIGLVVASPTDMLINLASMLLFTIFETMLTLGFMIGTARVIERLFKSFTSGFYWSFVAIVILEIILTIARQPSGMIG